MDIMIPAWVDGTLQPVEKLSAHELGLKHKAVSVFVMARGKVLIQQRAAHKYHTPGLWANTCCTHPEWNEDPAICAVRRLDEEVGVRGLNPVHRGTVEYRADVGGGMVEHEVVEVFLAEGPQDMRVRPNPDEVMAVRWIDYEVLASEIQRKPERFTPWLSIYLSKHKDLIFGDLYAAD